MIFHEVLAREFGIRGDNKRFWCESSEAWASHCQWRNEGKNGEEKVLRVGRGHAMQRMPMPKELEDLEEVSRTCFYFYFYV